MAVVASYPLGCEPNNSGIDTLWTREGFHYLNMCWIWEFFGKALSLPCRNAGRASLPLLRGKPDTGGQPFGWPPYFMVTTIVFLSLVQVVCRLKRACPNDFLPSFELLS